MDEYHQDMFQEEIRRCRQRIKVSGGCHNPRAVKEVRRLKLLLEASAAVLPDVFFVRGSA